LRLVQHGAAAFVEALPDLGDAKRRLERSISRTPSRASSPAMRRLSFDLGSRNALPAGAKPPCATTSTK
jgi:hypothetical protein